MKDIFEVAALLDKTIEKGEAIDKKKDDLKKSRRRQIRKGLSFNPLDVHTMGPDSPYYNPYDHHGDGAFVPRDPEHWLEGGRGDRSDPEIAFHRQVHNEDGYSEARAYRKQLLPMSTKSLYREVDNLIKAFPMMRAGGGAVGSRGAPVGTRHTWANGVMVEKMANGEWQVVHDGPAKQHPVEQEVSGKRSAIEEELKSRKKGDKQEPNFEDKRNQANDRMKQVDDRQKELDAKDKELNDKDLEHKTKQLDARDEAVTGREDKLKGVSGDELKQKVKRREKGKGEHVDLTKEELSELLETGTYAFVSAGRNPNDPNEKDMDTNDSMFKERHDKLEKELVDAGYAFTRTDGHYDGEETSLMVMAHEADRDHIQKLGKDLNQDSVIYSENGKNQMIYTTGDRAGKMHVGESFNETPDAKNYYTEMKHAGGTSTKFQLGFDDPKFGDKSLVDASAIGEREYGDKAGKPEPKGGEPTTMRALFDEYDRLPKPKPKPNPDEGAAKEKPKHEITTNIDDESDGREYKTKNSTLNATVVNEDYLRDWIANGDEDKADGIMDKHGLGDRVIKLEHVETKPEARGKGEAKALIQKMINDAKNDGIDHAILNASPMGFGKDRPKLEHLEKLYGSFGFKTVLNEGPNSIMVLDMRSKPKPEIQTDALDMKIAKQQPKGDRGKPNNRLDDPRFMVPGAKVTEEDAANFTNHFLEDFKHLEALDKPLRNAGATHFASRLKAVASLHKKMNERHKDRSLNQANDILGARGLAKDMAGLKKVLSELKSEHFEILETDDSTEGRGDGYRGIHLMVRGPNGRLGEIQLKTWNQQVWSGFSHDIIYKPPSEFPHFKTDKEIKKFATDVSDYLYRMDMGESDLGDRPKTPKALSDEGFDFPWEWIGVEPSDEIVKKAEDEKGALGKVADKVKSVMKYFLVHRDIKTRKNLKVEEYATLKEAKAEETKLRESGAKLELPIGQARSRKEFLETFTEYMPHDEKPKSMYGRSSKSDEEGEKKTGPGSRGGNVIGTYPSGDPKYEKKSFFVKGEK